MSGVLLGLGLGPAYLHRSGSGGGGSLSETPEVYSISGNANVSLKWDGTPDAGYSAEIMRKPYGGSFSSIATVASTAGQYNDEAVSNGSSYVYAVRWTDGGAISPLSNEVPGTPQFERYYHRGNPGFSSTGITGTAKTWYDRIRTGITVNKTYLYADVLELAAGDATWGPDLYDLGRGIGDATKNALDSLRLTGDLRFLDWVDEIWQLARAKLADYDSDGYLGWTWQHDPDNATFYRKENHEQDAIMTHGIVAMIAYAYAQNRDLTSPAGIDYGERADFWKNYLLTQFIPKWTNINGGAGSAPKTSFINFWLTHPWNRNALMHYYLWRLTGNTTYKSVADDHIAANFISGENKNFSTVTTDGGDTYVWRMGVLYNADGSATGNSENYLHESYYAQYFAHDLLDLYLSNHSEITTTRMKAVANAFAVYVEDNGIVDIASTIGGDATRGGIPWAGDSRKTQGQMAYFQFHVLGSWDVSDTIITNAAALHNAVHADPDDVTQLNMSYGLFINATLGKLVS